MKLEEFMRKAIALGMENDPRGKIFAEKLLKKRNEKYEKLTGEKKEEYELEKLWNPYSDSTILFDSGKEITKIMSGIDIDTSEVLLVDRLNEKNPDVPYDLILAHHPLGKGKQGLHDVMAIMQADLYAIHGVPINIGEGLTDPRAKLVQRGVEIKMENILKNLFLPYDYFNI